MKGPLKKFRKWIIRKFKIKLTGSLDINTCAFGVGFTWNNNHQYFTMGPTVVIFFWMIGIELIYKKKG